MTHRLLVVTAHPDDESGGFGGALLLAHQAGAETNLLCFTDGQAAHFRGTAADDAELARMRRAELDGACGVLGLTRCEVLHYPDGALPEQNFPELAGVVVERIRRWRPQVVLTFGGDGAVNLHRDHTMVSLVTTAAFHWAARAELYPETGAAWAAQKLYYSSPPFVSVRNHPELTATAATVPWSLELRLGALADEKIAAFGKHTSQQAVLARVGRDNVRKGMEAERYQLAAKRGMGPVAQDAGIWDAVKDE
ncbi:MAG TPA: PIG-L family deacetylase [Acidobacteriaceae bacterium]|jgi:LmbE family N-acetylglucosaminyl deacetylase|nr:PIG-L family deacetylase [Acidobacteriaceae bacterium]